MSIAQLVRELNSALWQPEMACEAAPELLQDEPVVADSFETLDGRAWVRVYLDGSSLDQSGFVRLNDPRAAQERRMSVSPAEADLELLAA